MSRLGPAVLGTAVSLLLAACSSSFGLSRGATEQAHETSSLWQVFAVAAFLVAALVYALILIPLVRNRLRRDDPEGIEGSQRRQNRPLELIYTGVPILLVVVLFVLSVRANERVTAVADDPDLRVRTEAFAWGWRFSYPNGVTVVSEPSGEFSRDPVIQLPVGQTARFELTSNDTIHAFFVPEFLYKHDAIPGRVFEFDITPTRLGTFQGHCAEFCGLNHAYMGFKVRVVPPDAFAARLAQGASG
jgi:cytochrome c oxidase subunit 2